MPLHSIELRKDSFDEEFQSAHRDVSVWLGAALAIVGRGKFDEVWYGNHNYDNVAKVPKMETAWYSIMDILELDTKLLSPLRTKSKLHQYNMLTNKTKQRIVSCAVIPKGAWNEPCGKCKKCQEFKQYVTNRL